MKPRAVLSLVEAGVFDTVAPRQALWNAALAMHPSWNGQAALPNPTEDGTPSRPISPIAEVDLRGPEPDVKRFPDV